MSPKLRGSLPYRLPQAPTLGKALTAMLCHAGYQTAPSSESRSGPRVERVQVPSSAKMNLSEVLLLAGLVALVVLLYLRLASVLPAGQVSQQALLAVDPPFVYRLMLPWLLGQLLPPAWLDTVVLRTVVTTLSVAACLALFPA